MNLRRECSGIDGFEHHIIDLDASHQIDVYEEFTLQRSDKPIR